MPYLVPSAEADIGHPVEYFTDRDIELDCRGPLHISSLSNWGVRVMVITASHDPDNFSSVVYRPVVVKAGAWICSGALLYNCTIGEGAIVAVGCVVRSRDVPDYTMVDGNPARIIARCINGKWEYLEYYAPLKIKGKP